MTNKEKEVILIGAGVVIIALIIFLIANGVNKKREEITEKGNTQIEQNTEKYVTDLVDGTKLNHSGELNKNKKYKDIEISNIQFTYENGKTILLATVKNASSVKHKNEIVKMKILGENNQVIDEIEAIMPVLEQGEIKQLNITISGVDVANAKDFKIEEKK